MKVHEGSLNLGEVQQWPKTCSMMFRGFREWILLDKLNRALQNLENHKVLLKNPVRPNEGPWLGMDPVGGSSFVPRVPWEDFWCLECKNMANITDFHLWAIPPLPRLIEDSKTPAWSGLSALATSYPFLPVFNHSYPVLPTLTRSYPIYLRWAKLIFSDMFWCTAVFIPAYYPVDMKQKCLCP